MRTKALLKDSDKTRERLLATVERLLVKEGFSSLRVNRIASQSRVAKVLIYRYFGGLEGLLEAYAKSKNFWPQRDEIIDLPIDEFMALAPQQRIKRVVFNFVDALRVRPHTMSILAWELSGHSKLVGFVEKAMAEFGEQLYEALSQPEQRRHPLIDPVIAILTAGLVHLGLAYGRTQRFATLPLERPDDWVKVLKALNLILDSLPASLVTYSESLEEPASKISKKAKAKAKDKPAFRVRSKRQTTLESP